MSAAAFITSDYHWREASASSTRQKGKEEKKQPQQSGSIRQGKTLAFLSGKVRKEELEQVNGKTVDRFIEQNAGKELGPMTGSTGSERSPKMTLKYRRKRWVKHSRKGGKEDLKFQQGGTKGEQKKAPIHEFRKAKEEEGGDSEET